jgi:hypothetical protein
MGRGGGAIYTGLLGKREGQDGENENANCTRKKRKTKRLCRSIERVLNSSPVHLKIIIIRNLCELDVQINMSWRRASVRSSRSPKVSVRESWPLDQGGAQQQYVDARPPCSLSRSAYREADRDHVTYSVDHTTHPQIDGSIGVPWKCQARAGKVWSSWSRWQVGGAFALRLARLGISACRV